MNTDDDSRQWGLIIPNAPVPFAIMGPKGRHRQVLVRSADAPMDLVVSDSLGESSSVGISIMESVLRRSSPEHLVAKGQINSYSNHDPRGSFYSFAWRGLASKSKLLEIRESFNLIAPDLQIALRSGSPAEVEWTLAPLLLMCREANEQYLGMYQRRRFLLISTAVIYAILGFLILSRIVNRIPF